jgi:RNA polymerase sigma factor (sigma-70 family)
LEPINNIAARISSSILSGEKISDSDWNDLREKLVSIIWHAKKSFKTSSLEQIDADSIIDMAILSALRIYDVEKGRFDYHVSRWIREELKREIIRNTEIKIPYRIAKKDYLVDEEDREEFVNPANEVELRDKYDLTKSEYAYLSHIKQVIGTRVEMTQDILRTEYDGDSFDREEQLINIIDRLGERDSYIIYHSFGICGRRKLDCTEMGSHLGISKAMVSRYKTRALRKLMASNFVREKLGDFYFD